MIAAGFVASALLAGWIASSTAGRAAFPDQGFEVLADTWRIVGASLAAFAVSETVDNLFGSWPATGSPTRRACSRRTRSASRSTASSSSCSRSARSSSCRARSRRRRWRRCCSGCRSCLRSGRRCRRVRSRGRRRHEADLPADDHRQGRCPGRERARPLLRAVRPAHRSASRRSTCSSTARPFDLVQHIDTVPGDLGHELEPRINAELMQSVLEIATPVCRTPAEVQRELLKLRAYVSEVGREKGLRVGSAGTHLFSLFERQRITACDRYRSSSTSCSTSPGAPTSACTCTSRSTTRRRRSRSNGLLPQLGPLLALSASSLFGAASRRVSRRAGRWCSWPSRAPGSAPLPRLRRLRRRGRPARAGLAASRTTRTSGGTSDSTQARYGRDPDLRRGHARRGRGRARGVLPGAREAPPSSTTAASRSRPTTASSRPRTSGSPPATASRRR